MRSITVLMLSFAAVVGLAGCTASAPAPTVDALPVHSVPISVADGVVGSGTLTSWNGQTSGELEVVAKAGRFTFVLHHFSTDYAGESVFALADTPVTMSQCGEKNLWQIGLPDVENKIGPTMHFPLPNVVGAFDDPTFFQTFLFIQYPNGSLIRGCQQPIVALAKISWTMPSRYPRLALSDRGSASGARGTVTGERGAPFSYDTARGDTWAAIARRFGITPPELLYLNPIRHPEAEPAIAYADQILNLSPTNRGNSESRRPGAQ